MPLVSAAAQKRCVKTAGTRMDVCRFVTAHRFCCPCALLYVARKGTCARETSVGFPLRVKSSARRRPLLRSKSACTKKEGHPYGCPSFLCKQPQVNTMNNPELGLFNLLTPMEIATEALFHHTKEEMKGGKPKSASSRLCSASE